MLHVKLYIYTHAFISFPFYTLSESLGAFADAIAHGPSHALAKAHRLMLRDAVHFDCCLCNDAAVNALSDAGRTFEKRVVERNHDLWVIVFVRRVVEICEVQLQQPFCIAEVEHAFCTQHLAKLTAWANTAAV